MDGTSSVDFIYGKLNRWEYGSGKSVMLLGAYEIWNSDKIYSISPIDSNGNFFLGNLDVPGQKMFMNPAYPRFSEESIRVRNTFKCSDSTARQVWGHLVITNNSDTSHYPKGRINRRNFNDWYYYSADSIKAGDFYAEYIYVNKDVNLSGLIENNYYDKYFNTKGNYTYEYNLNLKKGWNKQVVMIKNNEVNRDSSFLYIKRHYYYSNIEPKGAIWDYHYYNN